MSSFRFPSIEHAICAAILCALTACGGAPPTPIDTQAPIDTQVENRITITRGVYGQAASYSDQPGGQDFYASGLSIALFASNPIGVQPLPPILAMTTTDDRGFFQLSVSAADFVLCRIGELGSGLAQTGCALGNIDSDRARVDYTVPWHHWYCGVNKPCPIHFMESP